MDEHKTHEDHQMPKSKRPIKDFLPLVIIFVVIIAFTLFRQMFFGDGTLEFAMTSFMGGFFIVFGGFKILNWKGFVKAYQIYDIIAKRSKAYAYAYPLIELGLGAAYLTSFNLSATNWITLIVMAVSAIGVANELRKKNQIPCACLGVVFKIPMTWVTFIEDTLMALMALAMII